VVHFLVVFRSLFFLVLLHTISTWTLSGLALEAKQKQAPKQQGTGPSFFGVKGGKDGGVDGESRKRIVREAARYRL
jgi:hypothetical protein